MPQISSYTLPQMTDLVDRSFLDGLEIMPRTMQEASFVIKDVMPHGTGDSKRFAERLHKDQYGRRRDEGDSSQQARVQYGYEKDMQVSTVSLEISITKRMRVAGKDQQILDRITNLSEVCPSRVELDLAHRLTFAWSTTYTNLDGETVDIATGDTKALIATDHTLTGSATTYSTQITANPVFSKGALAAAEKSFVEESFDNLGAKISMNPRLIVIGDDPDTIHEVRELLNAQADVDTNNSGTFNVYGDSGYSYIKVGRIATDANGAPDTTKRRYWFLVDPDASDFYYCVLEQPYLKTPSAGGNGEEFSSENWNYLAACTYGMAIVTARWIRGSKGDGS